MTTLALDPIQPLAGIDLGLEGLQGLPVRIYALLKTKILNCELRPGMRIIEKDLSEAMHVSRTPLREARGKETGPQSQKHRPTLSPATERPPNGPLRGFLGALSS